MLMLQELLGYFLMGCFFMAALSVVYLPVYFLLKKKVPFRRQAVMFFFTVCVVVILSATVLDTLMIGIMDGGNILAAERRMNLIPFQCFAGTWRMAERKQITQTIANVLMFVPLGFIFPAAFPKMQKWWKTLICMALFSFFIEFVQYFIGRSADVDDLWLNTLGGVIGYGILYAGKKICMRSKLV